MRSNQTFENLRERGTTFYYSVKKCKFKDQDRKRKNSNLRQFSRLWQGMKVGQLFPSAAILLLLLPNIYPGAHIHIYAIYLRHITWISFYTYYIQVILSGYSTSMRCPYVSHQLWCWPTQLLIKRTVCKKLVQDLSLSTSFLRKKGVIELWGTNKI